ncbi:MAG: hypothetical protein ACPLKZ_02140 [Candidatus Bathyarchaeales archaeon]
MKNEKLSKPFLASFQQWHFAAFNILNLFRFEMTTNRRYSIESLGDENFTIQSVLPEKTLTCPRCGSFSIAPKGYVKTKHDGIKRVYRCKSCKSRFREKSSRKWVSNKLPDNTAALYLSVSPTSMAKIPLTASRTTINRWVRSKLSAIPDWPVLLQEKISKEIRLIMGIDTTVLKIGGKPYTYLHISDIPSKLPLAYAILPTRTIDDIAPILIELSLSGYKPKLIVCDLAPELLSVCGKLFPSVSVQGCIFHLRYWLDKELPTKRKNLPPEEIKNRLFLKKKIMQAALARTREQQYKLLEKLLDLRLDEAVKKVVRLFLENIRYYHPADELEKYGWKPAYYYNNVCERAMQSVKAIGKRMRGFKKPETAAKYINAFWYFDFLNKNESSEDKKSVEDKIRELDVPLLVYADDEPINIKDLAEVTKIDYDLLKAYLEKVRNMIVTSSYALSKKYAESVKRQLINLNRNTVREASVLSHFS